MSILDTIKSLFCKLSSCKSSDSKGEEQVSSGEVSESSAPEPAPVSEPEPAPTPKKVEPQQKTAVVTASAANLETPEDATLKRHYVSNLKLEIEAGMPPRPTDSTLKRHYDSAVQAELENRLG